MKIGTDSVLLGAMCICNTTHHILDIGTGTGLLALMLAQKSNATIDAVEIDQEAADEAKINFTQSKWNHRLRIFHKDIRQFETHPGYDLIISNPPYFKADKNMGISNRQRSIARHDSDLPFLQLIEEVSRRLTPTGKFWVILPFSETGNFISSASQQGLFPELVTSIYAKESKPANRVILCFGKSNITPQRYNFVVYQEDGNPTDAYYQLTKDYYLWKQFAKD